MMSDIARKRIQEIRIGRDTFCLILKRDYQRLLREAQAGMVDASEYGRVSIGRDLRRKRRKARLTQAEVASRASIRLETLSRLENGHGNPTFRTVRRILAALGEPF